MKIGILTYHDINNYGAQLQASSLQKYIESLGHFSEVIDYKPVRTRVRIIGTIIYPILKLDLKKAIYEIKKRKNFIRSIREILRVSERTFYTEKSIITYDYSHYDILICGSDELWNFNNYLGYLRPYIIDFPVADSVKKISYAASIGDLDASEELRGQMKKSLENFSDILVRDPTTLNLVCELSLNATRVLDPTFLFEFETKEPKIKNYLLLTGTLNSSQIRQAKAMAKLLGLSVISPGNKYQGYEEFYVPATALEWLGYIENASFHFTSLFHGSIFSMKYSTPFAVYRSETKQQKVNSLIELFGQEKRIVDRNVNCETLIEISKLEFDTEFHRKLESYTRESKNILSGALIK